MTQPSWPRLDTSALNEADVLCVTTKNQLSHVSNRLMLTGDS